MSEQASTRVAFVEALEALMEKDPRVVMVSADSVAVFRAQGLQERYARRIIEVGIAEQNAVMTAAGLAAAGMLPYVCTYAGFATMRACEQMRTFVAYPKLEVKFFGANAGIGAGEREGVTHQFFEDMGILRAIPGICVMAPADARQTGDAVKAAYHTLGPVYVRIGSGRDPVIYERQPGDIGRVDILADYGDAVLIAGCGGVLTNALAAARQLRERGVGVCVVNVPTVKPLDAQGLLPLLKRCARVVSVEDHNIIGGLGSALCELAAEHHPCAITRLGVRDVYPESGEGPKLWERYGMGSADIVRACLG